MHHSKNKKSKVLAKVTSSDIEGLFAKRSPELHRKVDATRDAYFGFIFPINREDFKAVSSAFGVRGDAGAALYNSGKAFSTFQARGRIKTLTNHIFGASILALRGKDLDTGLASVTDESIGKLVSENEDIVLEIASARASWFGRIFFPAAAFSNAIGVFGGKVSPDVIYDLADRYGFAAPAGERKTVRGDFGIGVWLTMLGVAD
jgi:hypothetical protein